MHGTTITYNNTGTQSCDKVYVIRITRIGSMWPRVVCYWNTSEAKEGKLKIHYERENKENQSNNAIKQTNKTKKTKQKEKWKYSNKIKVK